MERNIRDVFDKYKIPNVISGIDGCHFSFREKPRYYKKNINNLWGWFSLLIIPCPCYLTFIYSRGVPADRDPEQFINRKGFYSINAMVTGTI